MIDALGVDFRAAVEQEIGDLGRFREMQRPLPVAALLVDDLRVCFDDRGSSSSHPNRAAACAVRIAPRSAIKCRAVGSSQ